MTKISVTILLLVIMLTVSTFGAHFGWSVDGVPKGAEGNFNIISGMSYFYDMVTFSIDGVPGEISAIFLLVTLVSIYIIVTAVLPGGG